LAGIAVWSASRSLSSSRHHAMSQPHIRIHAANA
jgi:hypothetical protein